MEGAIEYHQKTQDHGDQLRPSRLHENKGKKDKEEDDNDQAYEHKDLVTDLNDRNKFKKVTQLCREDGNIFRVFADDLLHDHEDLEEKQPDE
jgi:hypothetical protein